MTDLPGRSLSAWREPRRGDRLRRRAPGETEPGGRTTLALVVTAIATFFTVASLSARQVTEPSTAAEFMAAGIAATVDIDRLLDDSLEEIRGQLGRPGAEPLPVPGFPVAVFLTPEDAGLEHQAIRDALLSRAAAVVYHEGSAAFDTTGDQSIDLVSGEAPIRFMVDRVNGDNHRLAGWGAVASAAVLGIAAVSYSAQRPGRHWLRPVGAAVVLGAVPGVVLILAMRLLVDGYGSDADPFAAEVRDILGAALGIPLRNFIVTMVAGASLVALGVVLGLVERFWPSPGPDGEGPRFLDDDAAPA